MAEPSRCCVNCRAPIEECMGFVKAGDVLKLVAGRGTQLRELCGHCVPIWQWTIEETLTQRPTFESTQPPNH